MFLNLSVLTYDNNEEDETASLDGVSTTTATASSTQTGKSNKKTKNRSSNIDTSNATNENEKYEDQDDDKSVDQKSNNFLEKQNKFYKSFIFHE